MVLYYDVTIKVLGVFIEGSCGIDAGGVCSYLCLCACVLAGCVVVLGVSSFESRAET